jgi:hypothetical protein
MILHTLVANAAYDGTGGAVACGGKIENLTTLINFFTCTIMNAVIPLLIALSVAGFVYGIMKFFLNPDNEEKRKAGKGFMLWGLITLFVIVTLWGVVAIFSSTFLNGAAPILPQLPQKKI